jgi:hypothetical protein
VLRLRTSDLRQVLVHPPVEIVPVVVLQRMPAEESAEIGVAQSQLKQDLSALRSGDDHQQLIAQSGLESIHELSVPRPLSPPLTLIVRLWKTPDSSDLENPPTTNWTRK